MRYDFIEEYFDYVIDDPCGYDSGDCDYYNVSLKKNLGKYKAGCLFLSIQKIGNKLYINHQNRKVTSFKIVTYIDENSES